MLNRVLEFKPSTWTYADYSYQRYVLIEVDPCSDEYSEIAAPFAAYAVEKVERIQNPYTLGCYLVRKEQLAARGRDVSEMRCYHPVKKHELSDALEFNLDVRRYTINMTRPHLYTQVDSIIASYDTFIVCKTIKSTACVYGSPYVPHYESEYVPEYVVKISKA